MNFIIWLLLSSNINFVKVKKHIIKIITNVLHHRVSDVKMHQKLGNSYLNILTTT